MEVEEGRGGEDRGEGAYVVWGPAPEDLKRRSSVFSFPPFFTFTSRSLLIFYLPPPYLWSALSSSPRSRTGRSVSGASRALPRGPQMGCQVQGLDRKGTKDPQKTHQKGWDLGKMCLIAVLLKGTACMECVPRVTARRFPAITQA